ncbi:MAG: protein kinase [Clostridium sp.]|jgi:serine/threonine protein kinase|nr:protein kinase [Clostridium sp.]
MINNGLFDGKYKIIDILGKGGMSTVYLAENVRLGTLWAIKEISKQHNSKIDIYVEPNILKKLNHPALPRIFDIIENNENFYIIMDYIDGCNLSEELKRCGKFPEDTVIDWAIQICDVLIYLHSFKPNPIIYRDMKPSNIMLTQDGKIKLIDFGIAREYKISAITDTVYIGTKGYAAPEQYGSGQTNERTDIYSLGITLYHFLTGIGPNDPPYQIKPIRCFDQSLSRELERIIDKCTRQDPDERFQSANELLDALISINYNGVKKNNSFSSKTSKDSNDAPKKKKWILNPFQTKSKQQEKYASINELNKYFKNISKNTSKVITITGHRGSGVTSSVVNLASTAAKQGFNTIIVDMDIEYRSTNMYFNSFHEKTKKDEEINASLIRTLAKPENFMTTAFNIKSNLWLTSLGYNFCDAKLIDKFFNSLKLIGMLSVLRSKFNLIILDMPLDILKNFNEVLMHIDVFGLCVSNNLYSVLSSLRNMEVVLEKEHISYINVKSKLLITKYNNRSRFHEKIFTQEKVCELITSGLSENFTNQISSAGIIPFSHEFDLQIEKNTPVINTVKDFEEAFGNILLRLIK